MIATPLVFDRYSEYYDLLYRDKDYAAEADYVGRMLRDAAPEVHRVLEFGSGTGRHGRLLARQRLHVVGVERSETMAARARAMTAGASIDGGSFECVHGDIRTVDLNGRFDAIISLFHVVSYQVQNNDLQRTFANAARHLGPRGVFFFDVWHGPAVFSDRPAVRVKRVENDDTRLWRIAEPALDLTANVVVVRYTMLAESKHDARLTTFEEEHRMRYLFPPEVDLLAGEAGFEVERAEEFLTGRPPSEHTWGVAYLLRKLA